ncbi:SdpI family protein [Chitinophaga defluvii]|uniref:SdpI family protein n=1 Tax=Chitinophaga defluvii TaxID=3163343 RepID=A0ABV2TD71_9BACT
MKEFLHSTYCNASLLAAIIFLFMGFFIHRYPPRSTKTWYGYRSELSTKNTAMWHAGNRYAAYISRRIGIILLLTGIACALFFDQQTQVFYYITVGAVIIGVLYMVGFTEWKLAQEFDETGTKK